MPEAGLGSPVDRFLLCRYCRIRRPAIFRDQFWASHRDLHLAPVPGRSRPVSADSPADSGVCVIEWQTRVLNIGSAYSVFGRHQRPSGVRERARTRERKYRRFALPGRAAHPFTHALVAIPGSGGPCSSFSRHTPRWGSSPASGSPARPSRSLRRCSSRSFRRHSAHARCAAFAVPSLRAATPAGRKTRPLPGQRVSTGRPHTVRRTM